MDCNEAFQPLAVANGRTQEISEIEQLVGGEMMAE